MKNGIILIDKDKNITSRDVVNMVCKKLNIKKCGHTGTLDPIATGLMIVCVNKATKLVDLLTSHEKTYIAKVKVGISTDTYDVTGKTLKEQEVYDLKRKKLVDVLNSFKGKYIQEVPIYSAVKVNGKKLYEYARNNIEVTLPKHEVEIKSIDLLEMEKDCFFFKVKVSKGTYIRSLINDIGNRMDIQMTMEELRRIEIADFSINDAIKIDEITEESIIPIKDCLKIYNVVVDDVLAKKIKNGVKLDNIYHQKMVLFLNEKKEEIAIYQEKDGFLVVYCMF